MPESRPQEIKDQHLNRLAIVYVRQSTEFQVQNNTGSTEAQRNQKRYALLWGWIETLILVIEDLGVSGTTALREGYQRIIQLIQEGKVGILIAVDFTRLGREAGNWFHLLNICAAFDVLVALDGRVYDMRVSGHLVYAKLMAVVSDIDTSYRSETMRRGRVAKAKAGKSVTRSPMGYMQKTWALDPRTWVQLSLRTAFQLILKLRSVGKTIRALNDLGMRFPGRKGPTEANESLLLDIYRNFSYTGAYEFGKSQIDPARKTPGGRVRRIPTPREERIVIEGHHEAYVSTEDWFEIQKILDDNTKKGDGRPAGRGAALLERLIDCPVHVGTQGGRRMMIHYGDARTDCVRAPAYYCKGERDRGRRSCVSVPARRVDPAIRDAVLARLTAPRLNALREALDRARRDLAAGEHLRRLQMNALERELEELRYRVRIVDPTNVEVVQELEQALREVKDNREQVKLAVENERQEILKFDDTALDRLLEIADQLLEIFMAETTTNEERKEVIRALVERVTVLERTNETIRLRIKWVDDEPDHELTILLPPFTQRKARKLAAQGLRPCEVGRRLNELELFTKTGRPWTAGTASQLLRHVTNKKVNTLKPPTGVAAPGSDTDRPLLQ